VPGESVDEMGNGVECPAAQPRNEKRMIARLERFLCRVLRRGSSRKGIEFRSDGSRVSSTAVLNKAKLEGKNVVARYATLLGDVEIGYGTTLAQGCVLAGRTIRVGRFCQFGPYACAFSGEHPLARLTIYNNERLFDGELKSLVEARPVLIGSDVYVGAHAVILQGVTIGHGAVVAGGATVREDVAPYGVVAGCPAKLVRTRFHATTVDLLLRLAWWNLPPATLQSIKWLFFEDLGGDLTRANAALSRAIDEISQKPSDPAQGSL
jgi:virginiamycin A acetyltransferase